jgi:rubrerythrin
MQKYNPKWDLSTIPDDVWRTEYARRIKPPAPRARIEMPCVQCGALLSARERRKPCPRCSARQPR